MLIVAFLAVTSVAPGQRLTFGVKGGVATLEATRVWNDESRRYIVGGTVEYRLWRGFAAEADFLYRRLGQTMHVVYGPEGWPPYGDERLLSYTQRQRADVFELPVLGKYYFRRSSGLQPFVLTGYSFRKMRAHSEFTDVRISAMPPLPSPQTSSYWTPLDIGAAVGGGVRWRAGRFSILPEFRYTRWGGGHNFTSKNQADVLLGITF